MRKAKCGCGEEFARINGRTLEDGVGRLTLTFPRAIPSPKKWVNVCPQCDAKFLRVGKSALLPFLAADEVMRTTQDFYSSTNKRIPAALDFCGFKFSKSAFDSAVSLFRSEYQAKGARPTTRDVEQLGSQKAKLSDGRSARKFSKKVCEWGRGERVWANLVLKEVPPGLGAQLRDWFRIVVATNDPEQALEPGTQIKGLSVSFASKHLRMISPRKFAVLDAVLSEGLGIALNTKGYGLFIRSLDEFKRNNAIKVNLATTEAGIFMLVRQVVRSED